MPAKLLMTALSAAALALGSPAAHADSPTYDCAYTTQDVGALSQTHEGVAFGYVVHAGDVDATIRCYTMVDGTPVSTTPTGTGVTAGPISFTASEDSHVEQCAEVTTDHGTITSCEAGELDLEHVWYVINDVVGDLVDHLIFDVVDPALCWALPWLAGNYVDVTVSEHGDVYVAGELYWDCPPYEWPPAG